MIQLFVPIFIGLIFGIPLAWFSAYLKDHSKYFRLGIGILISIGIMFLINAGIEIYELTQQQVQQEIKTDQKHLKDSESKESVDSQTLKEVNSETLYQTWEQTQRYEDGTLKAKRSVTHNLAGEIVPHGPAETYYPNGQMKWQGNYHLGEQTGKWKDFFPSGMKEGEGFISNDGKAEEKHWYENGVMKSSGAWLYGNKHGIWKTWKPDGDSAGEYLFEHGKLIIPGNTK